MTGKTDDVVVFLLKQDKGIMWDLSEHKEHRKRSLDSNAYFHVLCDKLRQKLGISMARCKNHLIADYGQIEYIDGAPMIYKTNAPEDYMMEKETVHTKCFRITEENGKPVYWYRIYRGSHTYNTAEMARLIDGTIAECKAQDIETESPDEIARMQALWESRYAKREEQKGLTPRPD